MAYISQEMKSRLAPAIKAVLKKYDVKATISISNHMTLNVNIKSGKFDFRGDYGTVNHYWIERNYSYDRELVKFLNELHDVMKGNMWYDRSDVMTDYFDTAYYISINFGTNRPYVKV